MEIKQAISDLGLSGPVGLGGCKACGTTLGCCEYNITVFDGKSEKEQTRTINGQLIRLHHAKLDESNPDI